MEENTELEGYPKRDNFAEKLNRCHKKRTKKLGRLDKLRKNGINIRKRLLYDSRKRVREDFDS